MRWPWQRKVNLTGPGAELLVSHDGRVIRVTKQTAIRLAAVYRCVTLISGAIARAPVQNAPPFVQQMMRRGVNSMQTWHRWVEWTITQAICQGDGLSIPQRDGRGGVTSMRNVDAMAFQIRENGAALPTYVVGGNEGFDPTQVIHVRAPMDNGLRGRSVLDSGGYYAVKAGIATETFATETFEKEALQAHKLEFPDPKLGPSPEQQKQLADTWKQNMATGNEGRGRLLIVPKGARHTPLPINAEQLQLIEARQESVTQIGLSMGVPSVLLNQEAKVTSFGSGVGQIGRFFVDYGLEPWAAEFWSEVNRKLDTDMSSDFSHLTRGSQLERYQAYAVATGNQAFASVETVQAMEGLPVEEIDQPEPPVMPQPEPVDDPPEERRRAA